MHPQCWWSWYNYIPFSVFTATVWGRGQRNDLLSSCIWGNKWALYTIPNSPDEKRIHNGHVHMCLHGRQRAPSAILPCPNVSSNLTLLLGINIFPVSSLICVDITGVSVRSLCFGSGESMYIRWRPTYLKMQYSGSILMFLSDQD